MAAAHAPSASGAAKVPSQVPYPVWMMHIAVPCSYAQIHLQEFMTAADQFVKRGSKGGTSSSLRVVIALADQSLVASAMLIKDPLGITPYDAGQSGWVPVVSGTLLPAAATDVDVWLTIYFVFDGEGRLRSSVKRTLKSLSSNKQVLQALADLKPEELSKAFAHCSKCPTTQIHTAWLGSNQDLLTYLRQRVSAAACNLHSGLTVQSTVHHP